MSSPQPNWKLPLILSTVLAVGGSFVYWHQYNHKPKQEKADTELKKPLAIPADAQIAMIKVKTGKGLIELKCQDIAAKKCKVGDAGKWKVTHPIEAEGDSDNIKDFINSATSVLATETVDLKEETPEKRQKLLKEYALSDEERTNLNTQFAELITEDGKRYTAWFGAEHPLGDKFFVARSVDGKINDETIFLISSYFKNNLAKDLTYFRDKTLLTFSRGDVESFEATTTKGKLTGKKVNGLWEINGFPGEHDKIETALASIAKTEAKDFPEADAYKGAKTVDKYTLKIKDKTVWMEVLEKSLDKGHTTDDGHGHKQTMPGPKKYFAKVSSRPETVEIDSVLVTQIDKSVNDFRKTTLFSDTEKATATKMLIEFKGAKSPIEFDLKQGTWLAKDPSAKLDPKKAQSFVDGFNQARVTQFLKSMPAGSKEEVTVTIGDDTNSQKSKYRFVNGKDKIYAIDLNGNRNEVLELSDVMKNALPFTEDSWKIK